MNFETLIRNASGKAYIGVATIMTNTKDGVVGQRILMAPTAQDLKAMLVELLGAEEAAKFSADRFADVAVFSIQDVSLKKS